MEGYVFLILLMVGTPVVLVLWLIVRALGAGKSIEEISRRPAWLETEVVRPKK